jgi:hypothetical protein
MPTSPPGTSNIDAAADQVLHTLGAQRDLPRVPVEPISWFEHLHIQLPDVSLFFILTLCAGILTTTLYRLRRGKTGWTLPTPDAAAAGENPMAHLQEADQHAAAGRLVEAMHELLLQALSDIRRHAGTRLDASLTSREILHQAPLPPEARDALATIISRVEWTYFGLRPATDSAWQECRAQFTRLTTHLATPPLASAT